MRSLVLTAVVAGIVGLLALFCWPRRGSPDGLDASKDGAPVAASIAMEAAASRAHDERGVTSREAVPAREPGPARLEVRVVRRKGGAPVPSVGIFVRMRGARFLASRSAVTDERGTAMFPELEPGPCEVECAGAQLYRSLELEPGAVASCTFEFASVVTISGTVVDADDAPVADAGIRVESERSGWDVLVARSDARGRFSVVHDGFGIHLHARKDGHAPSIVRQVTESDDEVKLVLPGAGAALVGQVRSRGQALAGALVRAELTEIAGTPYQALGAPPRLALARADREGRFAFRDLPAGRTNVAAAMPGFVLANVDTVLAAHEERSLDLELEGAGKLVVRVRTTGGGLVDGARAILKSTAGAWLEVSAPGKDETCRFDRVPIGEVVLLVEADGCIAQTRRVAVHSSERPLEVEFRLAVQAVTWIRGRLVTPESEPLSGWSVEARPRSAVEAIASHYRVSTDASGRFSVAAPPNVAFGFAVREPLARAPVVLSEYPDVFANGREVELVVFPRHRASASITARVVDTLGAELDSSEVVIEGPDKFAEHVSATGDGSVRVAGLPAGPYRLLWRGKVERVAANAELARIVLAPAERRDLGTLVAPAGRALRVIVIDGTKPVPGVPFEIAEQEGSVVLSGGTQTAGTTLHLAPGRYVLRLRPRDRWIHQSIPFEVPPDSDRDLEVQLVRGTRCHLVVGVPTAARPSERRIARLAIRCATGESLVDPQPCFLDPVTDHELEVWAPVGSFQMSLTLPDGKKLLGTFAVDSLEPRREPIRVRWDGV